MRKGPEPVAGESPTVEEVPYWAVARSRRTFGQYLYIDGRMVYPHRTVRGVRDA